jgi:hypothetical protein
MRTQIIRQKINKSYVTHWVEEKKELDINLEDKVRDWKREQEQDNENQYEKIFKMIYDWWSDKTKNVIDTRIKEMWKEQARNIVVISWIWLSHFTY